MHRVIDRSAVRDRRLHEIAFLDHEHRGVGEYLAVQRVERTELSVVKADFVIEDELELPIEATIGVEGGWGRRAVLGDIECLRLRNIRNIPRTVAAKQDAKLL